MRIKYLILSGLLLATTSPYAQSTDNNLFNHFAVGLSVGTPGIGLDVAMPIGNYVQFRAGADFMPNIKVNTDVDLNTPDLSAFTDVYGTMPSEVALQGKIGFTNGKLLFDVYPFKGCSFHVTAGAYFGSSQVVSVYNRVDGALSSVAQYNNDVENDVLPSQFEKTGVQLGNYLLEPDDNGNVSGSIKTAGFKPYLGLGFGRAVPKKRIGFMFDIGVQFWGTPKAYCFDQRLTKEDTEGKDGGFIKTLSKVTVYPVISFRICGRIF